MNHHVLDNPSEPPEPGGTDAEGPPSEVLLQRITQGNRDAFRTLYNRHSSLLFAVALRITRHPNLAADTVQEAFIQAWQNARHYTTTRGTAADWLVGLTRTRAIDLVRRAGPGMAGLGGEALADLPDDLAPLQEAARATGPDSNPDAAATAAALAALDPPTRRLLLLCFVDGLSQGELASRLGQKSPAIGAALRRGLAALAGQPAPAAGDPPDRAGLLVLGALTAEQIRELRREADREPALADDIAAWERRLAPLAALAPPAAPPHTLWPQLDLRIARLAGEPAPLAESYTIPPTRAKSRRAAAAAAAARVPARALNLWRLAAIALFLVCCGLAAALKLGHPDRPRLTMVQANHPGVGAWLIQLHANGDLEATAQGALTRPLDKDYELWAQPDGSDRAFPLGVLLVSNTTVLKAGSLPGGKVNLIVSLEDKGGSKSGVLGDEDPVYIGVLDPAP